jgi:chitin synthase
MISLIILGAIYGVQVLILLFQKEWQHIGWMVIVLLLNTNKQYIFALPLYSFYLPLYSFWHFDDFSWGNTRLVEEGDIEDLEEKGLNMVCLPSVLVICR